MHTSDHVASVRIWIYYWRMQAVQRFAKKSEKWTIYDLGVFQQLLAFQQCEAYNYDILI